MRNSLPIALCYRYLSRFLRYNIENEYPVSKTFTCMSVGWDVKWCPVSRITSPLARKRPFHWISMKSRLVRSARESSKFQNWSQFTNIRRRWNIADVAYNQSINQSINHSKCNTLYNPYCFGLNVSILIQNSFRKQIGKKQKNSKHGFHMERF